MKVTLSVHAQLSKAVFSTRKSFETRLDKLPANVLQYYYQLQVKELDRSMPSEDVLSFVNQNSAFKRFIYKDWVSLSKSKKRVYYALYFHNTKLNFKNMDNLEIARRLCIPTPASSEYMLFRSKFKQQFDSAWIDEKFQRGCQRGKQHSSFQSLRLNRRPTAARKDKAISFTKRFQDMCRECRSVWNNKVTTEQKQEITRLWEEQQKAFVAQMAKETRYLALNMSKLSELDSKTSSLLAELPVTITVSNRNYSPIASAMLFKKL